MSGNVWKVSVNTDQQDNTDSDLPIHFIGCQLIGQGLAVMLEHACKSNTGHTTLEINIACCDNGFSQLLSDTL